MLKLIQELLSTGELSKFKGLKEGLHFEVKGRDPYDFESSSGRYELAKDVSSFANADGGYIVIGLKCEPLIEENTDIVTDLDLIDKESFLKTRYEGIIAEYIYPAIKGLKVGWVENFDKQNLGIGYIHVPPQSQNKKYFLIKNIVEAGALVKSIVFGISQRQKSSNTPLDIIQLHQKIQRGMSEVSERLTRIEEATSEIVGAIGRNNQGRLEKDLSKRIEDILKG